MLTAAIIVIGALIVSAVALGIDACDYFEDGEVAHDTDRLDL